MNIVQINSSDILDGACIAAYRLHQGLLNEGINSRLLVGKTTITDEKISTITDKYPIATKLSYYLMSHFGLNYLTILSTFDIPKHKFYQEATLFVMEGNTVQTNYFTKVSLLPE